MVDRSFRSFIVSLRLSLARLTLSELNFEVLSFCRFYFEYVHTIEISLVPKFPKIYVA